ncbi:MAG: ISKra4 family transposase [Cyanothece sp. SIO1E1]|nr:ISKra4 family transposase [Cyanothece sp. SIO1E1]
MRKQNHRGTTPMQLDSIIREHLGKLQLFSSSPQGAEASVSEFAEAWRELGCTIVQGQLQAQLEVAEASYAGARQRRSKRYHTPLGTVELTRRVYDQGGECLGATALGLPVDGWFSSVKELGCALGVGSEFANANCLLHRWSGVSITERTLANQVEASGSELVAMAATDEAEAVCPVVSSISSATAPARERPVFYIGADGIHTPMRGGGTCEAKVGVMFWQRDHWRLSPQRSMVKHRQYVATLDGVDAFREHLNRCYTQTVQQRPHQVVFLGDGAAWIWLMAALLFPDAIQILDFFHVSEYLWEVARNAFARNANEQKAWVETQQEALKASQWQTVVAAAQRLPPTSAALTTSIERLVRYLQQQQSRIDYRSYLQQGLMIGSGVVESSNRRIVTVRLKQSGMFWSKVGAEAVMNLRACYLSSSERWQDFWQQTAAHP